MWEKKIPVNEIREIRVKTTVYLGAGAIGKMPDIAEELVSNGIQKVIIITGKSSYKTTGAWDHIEKALHSKKIEYALFNRVTPNPTVDETDDAVKMGRELGAQAVIGIGGGSPIDAAKSVAILLANPGKTARELYEFTFSPAKAVPIIAINLTHGTGTEANRFAVLTIPEKQYKPAIAYDCIYPMISIDDPALMTRLPENQTRYVSVDAINHVIEAATTKAASPFSILLAQETVRLVGAYLPKALEDPENITARYYLLYASLIAGVSFDNGLLHFTHALEHPLSAVKPDLSHGLGLAMLLPAIVKAIYPATAEILSDVLAPIVPGLTGTAAEAAAAGDGVRAWLHSVGIKQTLKDEGFHDSDVSRLTDLAFETPSLKLLLSLAPIEADKKTVEAIYRESL